MKISLKALRVNANLTQEAAAEKIGVQRETVINWETNKTYPNVQKLMKICEVYGCTLDDIFLPDKLA